MGWHFARAWMPAFLSKRMDRHEIGQLPTPATWESERDSVGVHYGDAMYWLLAHALLGNESELEEARERAAQHASTHVRAVAEAAPGLLARFEAERQALYEAASRMS